MVHDLTVRRHQFELAIRVFVLHVAHFLAAQETGTRTTRPKWLFGCSTGLEHILNTGERQQSLQRAHGREDDEEIVCLMPCQALRGVDPDWFELLGLVGHRHLFRRHARHQKRHIKAPRQITIRYPVRQHEHLVGRHAQSAHGALLGEWRIAIQQGHVALRRHAAIGVARQQHTKLLETLADRCNRLCQMQV